MSFEQRRSVERINTNLLVIFEYLERDSNSIIGLPLPGDSHLPSMFCDQESQNVLVTILLLTGIVVIVGLIFCICVFFTVRKSFHPFFAILFFVYMLTATGCTAAATIMDTIKYAGLPLDTVFTQCFGYVYFILYRISTPIGIFFLLERLYATRNSQTYEQERRWGLFLPLLPLGLLFAIGDDFLQKRGLLSASTELFSMLALQIFIIILMCFLSYYNRRLLQNSIGRGRDLSFRYQLAENIRVLRLVIPVTTRVTLATIWSLLGEILLGTTHQYELDRCRQEPSYFWLYTIQQFFAVVMVVCIPLSIIRGHPAITKAANRYVCFKFKTTKNNKMINVLGLNINKTQTTEEYFLGLFNEWNPKPK